MRWRELVSGGLITAMSAHLAVGLALQGVSAVWHWLQELLPGLMGAAVSLNFLGAGMRICQRMASLAMGTACASYLAPGLVSWLALPGAPVQSALQFLVGLFALAIVREVFREIDAGLLARLRERFLGGREQ